MKPFRALIFLLLLSPVLFAQGVRMSADFLPLAVGNQWNYEVTGADGKKIRDIQFAVREHSIVSGRSFYYLTSFPFVAQNGDQIHLLRYDKPGKEFIRVLDGDEGPLFLDDASATEVTEADSSGLPIKFVLRNGALALTFQRGVGIIEAHFETPDGTQVAKISSARVGEGVAPISATGAPAPTPRPANVPPTAAQQAGIPAPPTPEQKTKSRSEIVGKITDDNPLLILDSGESSEGHKLVLIVRNLSDKLLPFSFTNGQSYDFVVADASTGQEVWRWSRNMFFVTQVKRTEAILPDKEWKFEVTWNHRDNLQQLVPPGTYKVYALVTVKPPLESDTITIEVK